MILIGCIADQYLFKIALRCSFRRCYLLLNVQEMFHIMSEIYSLGHAHFGIYCGQQVVKDNCLIQKTVKF